MKKRSGKNGLSVAFDGVTLAFLLLWAVIVLIPLGVLVSVALKSPAELTTNPLGWPQQFLWSNFAQAWDNGNMGTATINSVLVTGFTLLALVLFGSMAAYPLARATSNKWYRGIYLYFIAGLIVPSQMGMIPLYGLMRNLGLINTLQGIIFMDIGGALPLVIFLYAGFIQSVPRELEEAAALDGAGPLRIFWNIVFPLLGPVTATVIITSGLNIWNDFFGPLLFLQDQDKMTLPLAIYSFVGAYTNNWGLIFAAIIVSALPMLILFIFLQPYYVKGIAGGALKG